MNKKIFSFGLVLLSVFVFGSFFANTALAARKASVVISPTTAFVEENITYTLVITNTNDDGTIAKIGSIEIQLPSEFETPSISILSVSSNKTWKLSSTNEYENGFNPSTKKIGVNAVVGLGEDSDKLAKDEFIEIQITATAPAIADSYQWTTTVFANLDFTSNTPFILSSEQPVVEVSERPTVTFIIRNGSSELHNGSLPLPAAGMVSITDANNTTHDIDARSVLGILKEIDDASEAFSISNLQDFGFGLYVKCILPNDGVDLCDNWQYAIGNISPFSSIDATTLSGGETVGIYFGTPYNLALSTNSITVGESITVTTQEYDYETDILNPLTDVSVSLALPNLDDIWTPIVVSTHPVDVLGNVSITITDINTYTLGIVDPIDPSKYFYIPYYTITISAPSGGGGGGNPSPTFDVQKALDYLISVQDDDGSFDNKSDRYTDWMAIAAVAGNNSSLESSISNYIKNNPLNSLVTTENERRAMALLSLDINPYSGTEINYIQKIIESFDGTQFGETDLVNDDIFALIVLANAGYSSSDEIISEDINYLLSPSIQPSNGFWGSIDMTAALIQALKPFSSITGVSDAINNSSTYLKSVQDCNTGGWGNVFSTSWAMQAESALDTLFNTTNCKTGLDYLITQQATDGSVSPSSDTYATSSAIAAASGKSWSEIMQSVSKPDTEDQGNSNGSRMNVSENNNDTQTPTNPVVCPKGDLFSTTTGQACTMTNETNIVTISTSPITTSNSNPINKIEDKKIIEIPKIKNISKSDFPKISESPTSINSESLANNFTENNLGANAGNAVTTEISLKGITKTIIYSVVNILTYIGKGFVGLINFLFAF